MQQYTQHDDILAGIGILVKLGAIEKRPAAPWGAQVPIPANPNAGNGLGPGGIPGAIIGGIGDFIGGIIQGPGSLDQPVQPQPVTPPSSATADNATINNPGTTIEFQFPPKLRSDSRGGNWNEVDSSPIGGEPIATYRYAKPRQMSLDWTYIVTGGTNGTGVWPATRIQQQLLVLRRYFVNAPPGGQINGVFASLAVLVQIYGMGGVDPMSFRLETVSIKHGDTLVGCGENAFHLRTDISCELRSWAIWGATNVGGIAVPISPGQRFMQPDWY